MHTAAIGEAEEEEIAGTPGATAGCASGNFAGHHGRAWLGLSASWLSTRCLKRRMHLKMGVKIAITEEVDARV
jgi:hypothetical protein